MRPKEIEKILRSKGWYEVGYRGSHKYFKHPTNKGKITVPQHNELKIKTLQSILKQAGLK